MKFTVKEITKMALIAALYVVITIVLAPISYGNIQVRLSEALTLLPFFMGYPAAIALGIGVMIANYFGSPLGMMDIILGPVLTLVAALLTARARNLYAGAIYPVLINAFGVAFILNYSLELPYWLSVLQVAAGQFIAVYVVGILLMRILQRYDFFDKIKE
ncbi:MAG: QueT transporter family protein [Halanaerobiaceae bacterium]